MHESIIEKTVIRGQESENRRQKAVSRMEETMVNNQPGTCPASGSFEPTARREVALMGTHAEVPKESAMCPLTRRLKTVEAVGVPRQRMKWNNVFAFIALFILTVFCSVVFAHGTDYELYTKGVVSIKALL